MGAFLYYRALKLQRRNNTCLCVRIDVQTGGGTGHFAGVRLVGPLLQLQRDTQDSAQSPSPSLHTRGASQQATGDLEPAQENREKTRILSRRNYRIKSLQAGWSKTGVGACRSHLIIICALLYCGFCATTEFLSQETQISGAITPAVIHASFTESHYKRKLQRKFAQRLLWRVGCSCN